MTLEAWVRADVTGGDTWRTVVMKENGNNYGEALYANTGTNVPSANARHRRGRPRPARHERRVDRKRLDAPRRDLRRQRAHPLRQRGPGRRAGRVRRDRELDRRAEDRRQRDLGEWFNGLIDEVRIYNRALTAAQITTDMNTSISAAGHPGADGSRGSRERITRDRVSLVGCGERQRRGRELQRLPLVDLRLHTVGGQPDRTADRAHLHGQRPRRRELVLPRHRAGCGRQRRLADERACGRRHLRHHAADRLGHGADVRGHRLRHDEPHGERVRQRQRRERAVQDRRDERRRPDTTSPYSVSWIRRRSGTARTPSRLWRLMAPATPQRHRASRSRPRTSSRRAGSSPPTASTRARALLSTDSSGRGTTGPSRTARGRSGSSERRSSSTARTPSSRFPTRTRSISRPG